MPHVLFYIKYLNNAISFTSTPHTLHQRPPSVGMPRHALRRRAPKYAPKRVSLGAKTQWFAKHFEGGVGPPARVKKSKTNNLRPILKPPIDLGNGPSDFAQILHTASSSDSKN